MIRPIRATPNGATALLLAIIASPALADLGDQLFKLLADDGAEIDVFGSSVAISGSTAIVGAPDDDDNGDSSGSAYLFDTTTGQQLFKLLPDDGGARQFFGASVAISGSVAIVGSPGDDDNGDASGSAYLFDTTSGQQRFKLLPNNGAEFGLFGSSVAISGSTAIVGAWGQGNNSDFSGAAYLFDTTTGQQLFKLLPDDGAELDFFGFSVAISANIAIVGSAGDDDNGSGSGSAYLFDTTTGQQLFKLLPDDGTEGDFFGYSVAISANTVIVGSLVDDDNGDSSGSAYLFDTTTGQQLFKLLPDDGAAGDEFGACVAISGNIAIVGTEFHDANGLFEAGSAYIFDTATGRQVFELLPDDIAAGDGFGKSVAMSDGTIIVGSPFDDDNGGFSGGAYLFDAGACPADIDGDGDADGEDFVAYLDLFAAGDPGADIDGDGDIDAEDFFGYLDLFVQPCQ